MFKYRPSEDKNNPERYLDNSQDAYILEGGIYKPKSYSEKAKGTEQKPGSNKKFRFFTDPKRDWVTIVVGILTLAVVGFYTHYARLQWKEMQQATKEATTSSNASSSAASSAIQALNNRTFEFRVEERPYVVTGETSIEIKPSGEEVLTIAFINTGRTPAIGFHIDKDVSGMAIGDTPFPVRSSEISWNIIGAGKTQIFRLPYGLNDPYKTQFLNNAKDIFFRGTVRYSDIFGCRHWTKYCLQHRHAWGEYRCAKTLKGTNLMVSMFATQGRPLVANPVTAIE